MSIFTRNFVGIHQQKARLGISCTEMRLLRMRDGNYLRSPILIEKMSQLEFPQI
jgi:hypothetical protein